MYFFGVFNPILHTLVQRDWWCRVCGTLCHRHTRNLRQTATMSIRSTTAMPLATSGKKEYGLDYFLKVRIATSLI